MSWALDATPLIYLAKAEQLDVIGTLDGPRLVPEAVHHEVVTIGVERGYDDARRIERAVEDGLINVVAVDTDNSPVAIRLRNHPGLSNADVAVFVCPTPATRSPLWASPPGGPPPRWRTSRRPEAHTSCSRPYSGGC